MEQVTLNAKPQLTAKHKQKGLLFSKSFVLTGPTGERRFKTMLDTVHIDKKWFYMAKIKKKVIYIYIYIYTRRETSWTQTKE